MTRLYNRQCTVIVGAPQPAGDYTQLLPTALKIQHLRIAFKIEKTDRPEPNKSEVQIFNLSDKHRALIEDKGMRCVVSAGYPGTEAQIFSGDVLYASHILQDRDWSTKLQLGDGLRAYKNAYLIQGFQPGVTFGDIVKSTAAAMGLKKESTIAENIQAFTASFNKGYTAHGPASREMTKLLASKGLSWSIQDGAIEILGPTDALQLEAPVISPETGLIGSPAMGTPADQGKPAYLKLQTQLTPSLRPGQRFQLKSSLKNGIYRVHKISHTGDTFGSDWVSDIEATPSS